MSDLAQSNESTHRRALRLALGVAMVFAFTQLTGWPMSHIAPFMTAILLQDSGPLPLRRGGFILAMALLSILSGLVIALFLAQFPVVLVMVACALLFRFYMFIIRSAVMNEYPGFAENSGPPCWANEKEIATNEVASAINSFFIYLLPFPPVSRTEDADYALVVRETYRQNFVSNPPKAEVAFLA